MTRTPHPSRPTDHDLMAYADGQLTAEAAAAIEAYLARHPEDAARVAEWQDQNRALATLFSEEEARQRTQNLPLGAPRRRFSPFLPAMQPLLAATVLVALGASGGWFARSTLTPTPGAATVIVENAFAAHALYSSEVLHPVEVDATQESHLVSWLSNRLGAELRVPDLSSAGYRLVGGRLLPGDSGAAAQFMYEDAGGARLTVYAMSGPTGQLAAFQYLEKKGLSGIYWQDQTLRYAVIAPLPRDQLTEIATQVYKQFI